MTFLARGGDFTYLLIRLDLEHNDPDRIAALAHELTHAMEVAAANPPIGSETELARLYRQIGQQVETGAFESIVAVVNERAARRQASPPLPHTGRYGTDDGDLAETDAQRVRVPSTKGLPTSLKCDKNRSTAQAQIFAPSAPKKAAMVASDCPAR